MPIITKALAILLFSALPISNAGAATFVQTGGASHVGGSSLADFQKYGNNFSDPLLAVIFEQIATGGKIGGRVTIIGGGDEVSSFLINSVSTGVSAILGASFTFNTPMSGSTIVSAKSGDIIAANASGSSTHTYTDIADLSFFIGSGSFQTLALASPAVGTVEMVSEPKPYIFTPISSKDSYHYSYKLLYVTGGPQVAAVPEPSTWLMLIFGFFAVGTFLRWQQFSIGRAQAHL